MPFAWKSGWKAMPSRPASLGPLSTTPERSIATLVVLTFASLSKTCTRPVRSTTYQRVSSPGRLHHGERMVEGAAGSRTRARRRS